MRQGFTRNMSVLFWSAMASILIAQLTFYWHIADTLDSARWREIHGDIDPAHERERSLITQHVKRIDHQRRAATAWLFCLAVLQGAACVLAYALITRHMRRSREAEAAARTSEAAARSSEAAARSSEAAARQAEAQARDAEAAARQAEAAARYAEVASFRAQHDIRLSEERFRSAFDHAPIGMALVSPEGQWVRVNHALCDLLGYSEAELLVRDFQSMTHPEDLDRDLDQVRRAVAGETDTYRVEKRFIHKKGHIVWALLAASLVRDDADQPLTFISQIQDITQQKFAEERLRHDALHDPLTGLPNRKMFRQRLEQALGRARYENDFRFAVLFLDLDRFKQINDTLGHETGDKLLRAVTEKLRKSVRSSFAAAAHDEIFSGIDQVSHTVARLGGDEFTVILEGIHEEEDAIRVARRILADLNAPHEIEGREVSVSVSVGVAIADNRYHRADDIVRDADDAMYHAKALGRARYVLFEPGLITPTNPARAA